MAMSPSSSNRSNMYNCCCHPDKEEVKDKGKGEEVKVFKSTTPSFMAWTKIERRKHMVSQWQVYYGSSSWLIELAQRAVVIVLVNTYREKPTRPQKINKAAGLRMK